MKTQQKIDKLNKLEKYIQRKLNECKEVEAKLREQEIDKRNYVWMHLTFAESCVLIPSLAINLMHYVR